jgi:hypothetical protein
MPMARVDDRDAGSITFFADCGAFFSPQACLRQLVC